MNPRSVIIVATSCGLGFLIGWGANSVATKTGDFQKDRSATENTSAARRRATDDGERKIAAGWIARLDGGDARQLAGEIPPGEMRAVIDGVMNGIWGDLSAADRKKLSALIAGWALQDREGALAWARGLRHPTQREVGLTYIAAALADTDPQAAFDIYSEQEKVTLMLGMDKIHRMITKLGNEAVAKGPQALLDLLKRIPGNESDSINEVSINYPDGFDYAAMIDGLSELGIGIQGKQQNESKPYVPNSPLGQWAVKDPDAAFSYFSGKTTEGYHIQVSDLTGDLVERWGREAAREWLGGKVASLHSAGRKMFLMNTGVLNTPSALVELIGGVADPAIANDLRYEAIQITAPHSPHNFQILAELPNDEKLDVISRLRGLKNTEALKNMMVKWEVSGSDIETVLTTVTHP